MVYPFCRKVHEGGHEGCLPHDKKDSDETIHNLQLGLEVERPERTTTFSFYRYFTRKIFIFLVLCDFFQTPYTEPLVLFMKFPTRVLRYTDWLMSVLTFVSSLLLSYL